MSDVSAIFGILLTLGIAFPGLLTAWWLMFPAAVERACQRLDATPWSCWWLGLAVILVVGIPIVGLIALPFGPAKFMGWTLLALLLGLSGVGAAGLAEKMSVQIGRKSAGVSAAGAFVRGALVLELAAVFPLIGWLLVIPVATILSIGATGFAFLRWMPRGKKQAAVVLPSPSQA
jgi:hypothetical protein